MPDCAVGPEAADAEVRGGFGINRSDAAIIASAITIMIIIAIGIADSLRETDIPAMLQAGFPIEARQ